jgi:hypothetical protein
VGPDDLRPASGLFDVRNLGGPSLGGRARRVLLDVDVGRLEMHFLLDVLQRLG